MIYEPRSYRKLQKGEKEQYEICIADTDLFIISDYRNDHEITRLVRQLRSVIVRECENNPGFLKSLKPIDSLSDHPLIKRMVDAAQKSDVGPMAAVAGAIAEGVGHHLLSKSQTAIVENGGDLFVAHDGDLTVRVVAGKSSLSNQLGIHINKAQMPMGICTSSGTVGHSLSFGRADAVVVLSKNGALADAVATASANRVKKEEDISEALEYAMSIEGIQGVLIIVNDTFGAIGDFEIKRI